MSELKTTLEQAKCIAADESNATAQLIAADLHSAISLLHILANVLTGDPRYGNELEQIEELIGVEPTPADVREVIAERSATRTKNQLERSREMFGERTG